MSFLVPLYLAGALAIAIPIYLHLRRKPPKDEVPFSSLMFLEPTKHQPIKRRSQFENVPLLLLRCLALLLLAAMFARPFLPGGDVEGEEGKMRTVLLLDTSASMQRAGVWEDALAEADKVISKMEPDGALAVLAVGDGPRVLTTFADWDSADANRRKTIARSSLEDLAPGWEGSNLGAGLITAAELIADASTDDETSRAARVVVISDLQSGASLEDVADASWPADLRVDLVPLEAAKDTNVAIATAASVDPDRPVVRLRNDPTSEASRFTVQAGDQQIAAVVPPGESRLVQLAAQADEVTVQGDAHDFDNRLYLAPREPALVKLLFLGEGKPDDSNLPEYYFRRAFGASQVMLPKFVDALADDPALLAIARPLREAESDTVRDLLEEGKDVLLVMASTEMKDTLAKLTGWSSAPALREYDRRYALLENIDFAHPALREFRDPRWRDFTDVHFWRYRRLDDSSLPENAQVIARFDTGDPAWVDFSVGSGSLLVMLSGWHPRDSQLSLSSKFVPLLFSIFSDHGPQVSGARQLFVGEPLPLEADETDLTQPDGESVTIASEEGYRPARPGIYRVSNGERERAFAVNLRPSESELAPLANEALAALGVPVEGESSPAVASETGKRSLLNEEAESRQNLWRWAVVILLSMLVFEAWLASRAGRGQEPSSQPEGATP